MLAPDRAVAREPARIQLRWSELESKIANRKVAFVLPDGTHVEGKAIAVEPAGLRLKVTRTSDRRSQPKGKQLVRRQSISLLRVTEYRKLGRLLGTFGAIGATSGIVAAQQIDIYEGPLVIAVPAVIAAGIAGSGVAGYYGGKAIDKRVTEISIVPEGQ